MATWYVVLVYMSGQVVVAQEPITYEACQARLRYSESLRPEIKTGCVEIK